MRKTAKFDKVADKVSDEVDKKQREGIRFAID